MTQGTAAPRCFHCGAALGTADLFCWLCRDRAPGPPPAPAPSAPRPTRVPKNPLGAPRGRPPAESDQNFTRAGLVVALAGMIACFAAAGSALAGAASIFVLPIAATIFYRRLRDDDEGVRRALMVFAGVTFVVVVGAAAMSLAVAVTCSGFFPR